MSGHNTSWHFMSVHMTSWLDFTSVTHDISRRNMLCHVALLLSYYSLVPKSCHDTSCHATMSWNIKSWYVMTRNVIKHNVIKHHVGAHHTMALVMRHQVMTSHDQSCQDTSCRATSHHGTSCRTTTFVASPGVNNHHRQLVFCTMDQSKSNLERFWRNLQFLGVFRGQLANFSFDRYISFFRGNLMGNLFGNKIMGVTLEKEQALDPKHAKLVF